MANKWLFLPSHLLDQLPPDLLRTLSEYHDRPCPYTPTALLGSYVPPTLHHAPSYPASTPHPNTGSISFATRDFPSPGLDLITAIAGPSPPEITITTNSELPTVFGRRLQEHVCPNTVIQPEFIRLWDIANIRDGWAMKNLIGHEEQAFTAAYFIQTCSLVNAFMRERHHFRHAGVGDRMAELEWRYAPRVTSGTSDTAVCTMLRESQTRAKAVKDEPEETFGVKEDKPKLPTEGINRVTTLGASRGPIGEVVGFKLKISNEADLKVDGLSKTECKVMGQVSPPLHLSRKHSFLQGLPHFGSILTSFPPFRRGNSFTRTA